jgi:hypothetical protein
MIKITYTNHYASDNYISNVYESTNDHLILQTKKWLKWMLNEYQPII